MSDLLLARAASRGGILTSRDIAELAVPPRAVARLVSAGVLTRVGPRAYVTASALDASPDRRHQLLAQAVVASFEDRVAASHQSAAATLGLPVWGADLARIHVCRVQGTTSRRRAGLVVHENHPGRPLVRMRESGVLCVLPALAAIGTAMTSGEQAGLVVMDQALRREMTSPQELTGYLDQLRHRPGLAAARRAVALADGRSESVGETRTRFALAGMRGLPPVTPQYPFEDDDGRVWARGDLAVGEHLILEFDGRLKYRASQGSTTREVEEIVWAEKRREDRIRRGRKVVERIVWADLDRPGGVAAIVRRGLAEVTAQGLDREAPSVRRDRRRIA